MLFRWLHRRSKQLTQEKACICGDLRELHGDEVLYARYMEEVYAEVAGIVVPPLPTAPVEMRGTTFLGGGASRLSPEAIQHATSTYVPQPSVVGATPITPMERAIGQDPTTNTAIAPVEAATAAVGESQSTTRTTFVFGQSETATATATEGGGQALVRQPVAPVMPVLLCNTPAQQRKLRAHMILHKVNEQLAEIQVYRRRLQQILNDRTHMAPNCPMAPSPPQQSEM
jgi:hypothetical protein